jgi:CubicO group peptidase (beta-lactamase class C family)
VYSGKLTLPLDTFAAGLGDHTVVTTLCPGGKERMRRLMNVLASARADLRPLATHRFPLDRIEEAYDMFANQRDGVLIVRYAYCSATMNLMGAALTTATGKWLPELFDRTVARPLQFGPYHWNLLPTDEGYLGGGAWLRPRDLLKIGQVYLDGGRWHGRPTVDTAWVTRSTAPQFHISPATTGLDADQFGNSYREADDAYAWHLGGVRSGEHVYSSYAATGNGGQVLIVVPELELTVVFTGGNYRQGGIWGRWGDEIVGGEIIPAIRR